ncbi:hypothetical protein [Gordonia bronchialis]|uniref:hypothetical protein n=1 Tax=Gordonia bronchialis TaxID=2054 RepID=UPI00226EB1A7|nr:hypothetical protein [Gordonia bronchialis]
MAMAVTRSETDLIEMVNTDSAARERELIADRDRALLHAQIEILDPDLRAQVDEVAAAIRASRENEDTITVIDRKAPGNDRIDAAARQSVRLKAIAAACDALFAESVTLLPVHLSDEQSGRKRKARR